MTRTQPELIAFLGPSLPRKDAERELRSVKPSGGRALSFALEPPAQQGDVWRALARRPRAIALIDGVFESTPSVWHHELLDALDGGVVVFGAASMGALRASELWRRGMIGVGKIYARYRNGFDDDAAVALLHSNSEFGFTPLTIPLVNAEHAIDQARRGRALTRAEAERMRSASAGLHYQERRWPGILERAGLSPAARVRWDAFALAGLPDLKADDARLCLREAARAALASRSAGSRPPVMPRSPPASALVRARRAQQQEASEAVSAMDARGQQNNWYGNDSSRGSSSARRSSSRHSRPEGLSPNDSSRDDSSRRDSNRGEASSSDSKRDHSHLNDWDPNESRDEVAARRTLFISAVARASGIAPGLEDLRRAEERLLGRLDGPSREKMLYRAGIAEDELRRACETLALESLALENIDRFLADGPSPIESKRFTKLIRALARKP